MNNNLDSPKSPKSNASSDEFNISPPRKKKNK